MSALSSLSVVRISIHPVRLALRVPFKIATMEAAEAPSVFVRAEAKGGLVGWGEASFMQSINGETQETAAASLKDLARMALGRSACSVNALSEEFARALPGQTAARCALDTALWDIAAQAAGLPLWAYMGGENRPLETDMTIGALPPARAKEEAQRLREEGFRIIKLKIGTGLEEDAARFAAAREGAPGGVFRLDANQGYARQEAHAAFSGSLYEGCQFVEQPLARHDLEGMKWLSGFSRVPVMADESVFGAQDAAACAGCCPLVNVKISKSGGLTGALAVAQVAEAHGLAAMMGGMMETRLGVTASAHAGAARRVFRFFDLDAHKDHLEDPIEGGISIREGLVHLPDSPGLGARPEEAFLARHPRIVVE